MQDKPYTETIANALVPATGQTNVSAPGGSTLIDPNAIDPVLAEFLALDMDKQLRLMQAVSQFSNDHALFIVGPDKPSKIVVDNKLPNRELQPFRVGNSADPSKVAQAAKWWTWTAEVRLKVHYVLWFEDVNQAKVVHGLVNIALDGEGFPISSDLYAWHDLPLTKLIEVINRCATMHGAATRTNKERLDELMLWAAHQWDHTRKEDAAEQV